MFGSSIKRLSILSGIFERELQRRERERVVEREREREMEDSPRSGGLSSPEAKLGMRVEDLWDIQEPRLSPTEKLNACFESVPVSAFPPASSEGIVLIQFSVFRRFYFLISVMCFLLLAMERRLSFN